MTQPKIRRLKITDYLPDSFNANLGSERGLQMLEKSLNEVGAGRSLVADAHDRIPAGNKTLEAAMNAGIEDVIEIETDGRALVVHKRSDWDLEDTKGAARKYAYLDNRVAQVSLNWDAAQIAADVEAGVDMSRMFHDWELDVIAGKAIDEPSWDGMPEFENEDLGAFQSIRMHFATKQDVEKFARLINQTITENTKYLWFPQQEKESMKQYSVVDES